MYFKNIRLYIAPLFEAIGSFYKIFHHVGSFFIEKKASAVFFNNKLCNWVKQASISKSNIYMTSYGTSISFLFSG